MQGSQGFFCYSNKKKKVFKGIMKQKRPIEWIRVLDCRPECGLTLVTTPWDLGIYFLDTQLFSYPRTHYQKEVLKNFWSLEGSQVSEEDRLFLLSLYEERLPAILKYREFFKIPF